MVNRKPSRSVGEALIALTRCGTIEHETTRSWRSLTFSGERCDVRLRFNGIEQAVMGEALIEELAEAGTFDLAGRLVVDIDVLATERVAQPLSLAIEFSVLTLDMAEAA